MGNRKNILKYVLATDQSLAATFSTKPTVIDYLDNCSYQINVSTSDSTGSFAVEVSNDYNVQEPSQYVSNPGTWTALTLSGIPAVQGTDDQIVINLNQLPFGAFRLTYTASTPGTGTCTIVLECKQVGG